MCCKKDLDDQWWFRWAVDVLYWYIHRNDKKNGDIKPSPPGPPSPNPPVIGSGSGSGIDAPIDSP
jgi:hypothetical protein